MEKMKKNTTHGNGNGIISVDRKFKSKIPLRFSLMKYVYESRGEGIDQESIQHWYSIKKVGWLSDLNMLSQYHIQLQVLSIRIKWLALVQHSKRLARYKI